MNAPIKNGFIHSVGNRMNFILSMIRKDQPPSLNTSLLELVYTYNLNLEELSDSEDFIMNNMSLIKTLLSLMEYRTEYELNEICVTLFANFLQIGDGIKDHSQIQRSNPILDYSYDQIELEYLEKLQTSNKQEISNNVKNILYEYFSN